MNFVPRTIREEDKRVHLVCRVTPKTLREINDSYPIAGNIGKKVDMLISEVVRLRASTPNERRRMSAVREFLLDPAFDGWSVRKIATQLKVSKSLVSIVRKEMAGAVRS